MSTVDVIVPCYNYGRYLTECVESVLSQEGVEVRVLIIDDCSTDDSAEIGASLATRDPRVEFRRHEVNRGHIATYNEGLEWTSGDYMLLISADDLLLSGSLKLAATSFTNHPSVGLVYGREIVFDSAVRPTLPVQDTHVPVGSVLSGLDFISLCFHTGNNPVATPTAVVRTSIQKEVGYYRAELPHTADLDYWLRTATVSDVCVLPAEQALKRNHLSNMQHAYVRPQVGDLQQRSAAFELFLNGDGSLLEGKEDLRSAARSALAWEAFWRASMTIEMGDTSVSNALLRFASETKPDLCRTSEWFRLRIKRTLGPLARGRLLGWVDQLRGRGIASSSKLAKE